MLSANDFVSLKKLGFDVKVKDDNVYGCTFVFNDKKYKLQI